MFRVDNQPREIIPKLRRENVCENKNTESRTSRPAGSVSVQRRRNTPNGLSVTAYIFTCERDRPDEPANEQDTIVRLRLFHANANRRNCILSAEKSSCSARVFANVIPQARMTLQRNTESGCGLRIIGCSNTPESGCARSAVLFYTIVVPTQHLAVRLRCITTFRPGSRVVCLQFAESIARPPFRRLS